MPGKTDYIKAFKEAIEEADLENEIVVRNLDNALVMASARYSSDGKCTDIEALGGEWSNATYPAWNFCGGSLYRLKPEPQYKPFDVESFLPYRDCWIKQKKNTAPMHTKIMLYAAHGGWFWTS